MLQSVHAKRRKLNAAFDFVLEAQRRKAKPDDIIIALEADHGAKRVLRPTTNSLRCAGVTATCTWSKDEGLLAAWRKNASVRIAQENQA